MTYYYLTQKQSYAIKGTLYSNLAKTNAKSGLEIFNKNAINQEVERVEKGFLFHFPKTKLLSNETNSHLITVGLPAGKRNGIFAKHHPLRKKCVPAKSL